MPKLNVGFKDLEGKITILFNHEGMSVEIIDSNSGSLIIRAELNQEQTCQALSRLASTYCKMRVIGDVSHLGLKYVTKWCHTEIPEGLLTKYPSYQDRDKYHNELYDYLSSICDKDWYVQYQFTSQNSFSSFEGKHYVNYTVFTYMKPAEADAYNAEQKLIEDARMEEERKQEQERRKQERQKKRSDSSFKRK